MRPARSIEVTNSNPDTVPFAAIHRRSSWVLFALLGVLTGCSDDSQQSSARGGPPGGMLEVDAGLRDGASSSGSGAGGSGGSGGLLNGGLGAICDTDADCPSGLTCNLDPVDWIAHRQCSTYCD